MSSARDTPRRERLLARATVEIVAAAAGLVLVGAALAASQPWLDRHFLPSFFLPRLWYVRIETAIRVLMAAAGGLMLLVVRPLLGRLAARGPGILRVLLAVVLAFGASELVLRRVHLRAAGWLMPEEEPRRQPDARLGWTLAPSRTGHRSVGGRAIEYAIDPAGYRVRRADEPVDPIRPTILFTGESVMFGEGLTWDESLPAQVEAITGVQSANLAVHGFGNDQAYLRLQTELPRFRHPVAVVSLFMTALFGRNMDDDRPHLGPGLSWLPPQQRGPLASIARVIVPYRSDAVVERGIIVTREVLQATVEIARARGATPLIVVPELGREDPTEAALRKRIFDGTGLPDLIVETDAAWRLPWDRHPNARAAQAIAAAIATRLQATRIH